MQGFHGGAHMGDDFAEAMEELDNAIFAEDVAEPTVENEAEAQEDPYAPEVTKIKSFNLGKPISLQEAIFSLDYIDHDFFVFLDEETNQVSVVYKRNAGGIGLIQPQ